MEKSGIGKFSTAVFDKRDDFNFHIVNLTHMDIPTKPACGVYISQLVRILRTVKEAYAWITSITVLQYANTKAVSTVEPLNYGHRGTALKCPQ